MAFNSAPMAVQLLGTLNNISALKNSYIIEQDAPFVGQLIALYRLLGTETMTFEQYSAFIERLLAITENTSMWIQTVLRGRFNLDIQVLAYLNQLAEEEKEKIIDSQDMRVTYNNLKDLGVPPFDLIQSSDNQIFFGSIIPANNSFVQNYMDNKHEYEAQENLLDRIVRSQVGR